MARPVPSFELPPPAAQARAVPPESWGRFPRVTHASVVPVEREAERLPPPGEGTLLPHGLGRSYGDVCLNAGGTLLRARGLDRILSFDLESGVLVCEGGVTLGEVLQVAAPRGWFLPVVPGTQHVTVGGAIANDVHGKNHHRAGTFGRHVRWLELLRSDGRRVCGPAQEADWFGATVGGLGLTGVVVRAALQLRRVEGHLLRSEAVPFTGLGEALALSRASDATHEYTVAWVDCLARGEGLGRGVFFRANHATPDDVAAHPGPLPGPPRRLPAVPVDAPEWLLGPHAVAAFNRLYLAHHRRHAAPSLAHAEAFFFPLDRVGAWNRLYGPRGLLQFQCVVPHADAEAALGEVLGRVAASGRASFLAVLKAFGDVPSPGWLSFPRPGVTLALDFAHRGEPTLRLLGELEQVVKDARGALYPAKDACMRPETFAAAYPQAGRFARFVDPALSSSFWRRVRGAAV